jgi:hypothetical protein
MRYIDKSYVEPPETIYDCPNCKTHNSLMYTKDPIERCKMEVFEPDICHPLYRKIIYYTPLKFVCAKCGLGCEKITDYKEEYRDLDTGKLLSDEDINELREIRRLVINMIDINRMRKFSKEESKTYSESLKKIYKSTGINIFDL